MSAAKASADTRIVDTKHGKAIDHEMDNEIVWEFGGPVGVTITMIFSHFLMYYLWACLEYNKGGLLYPTSFGDIVPFFTKYASQVATDAAPTAFAVQIYLGFILMQAILSMVLPGVIVKGLPVPSEGNRQLDYNCNGVYAWYITLALAFTANYTGYFRLSLIIDNLGPLTTVSIIFGDVVSLLVYVLAIVRGKAHRMSGNFFYDFFMGAWLNPRIGNFDLKMWAEIRVAWIMLFFLTVSAACKQYETHGHVCTPLIFMIVAHTLYTNACMKGEECIPTTWDIFYEKWGWMLIYWNCAGVPMVYCFQSMYILKNGPFEHSTPYTAFCFTLLLTGYYIWDTANSQKNRFRMKLRGTYIPRKTFPQLPWGTLENPRYLKTEHGNLLLTDGWYRYARKIHYTADIMMALSWGLICGFGGVLPYYYVTFFFGMINHRGARDMERCARKYGKDWDKYCETVPYIFIPYVY